MTMHRPGSPRGTTTPALGRTGICRFEEYSGPRLDPADVIHSRLELRTPGIERLIATFANKLKIIFLREGFAAGGYAFRGDELLRLNDAARLAVTTSQPIDVARIPLPSGALIEISGGGGRGRVSIRTVTPDGIPRRPTIIQGDELDGLRRALRHLGVGKR